jgi:hypothetical protein
MEWHWHASAKNSPLVNLDSNHKALPNLAPSFLFNTQVLNWDLSFSRKDDMVPLVKKKCQRPFKMSTTEALSTAESTTSGLLGNDSAIGVGPISHYPKHLARAMGHEGQREVCVAQDDWSGQKCGYKPVTESGWSEDRSGFQ